jgi:Fur family peroxide stress response transcriptional regulator
MLILVIITIIILEVNILLKNSQKREVIKQCLISRYDHPTADMVYASVREQFPNISLGTVYRNLGVLVSTGEIIKISSENGPDRFDGHTEPHYHITCQRCGAVEDIFIDDLSSINKVASENYDGEVLSSTICFTGLCSKCKNNNK